MSSAKRILVIGAGPKGIALAAKAHALDDAGQQVPEVYLLDHQGSGANWTGNYGYTDGGQTLATSPVKDVGFPYRSRCWGNPELNREINFKMLACSWQAFLVDDKGEATRQFADWVDRGLPYPSLAQWAEYLEWVRKVAKITVHKQEVFGIDVRNGKWILQVEDPVTRLLHVAPPGDALVVTGPGPAKLVEGYEGPTELVTDAQHLWDSGIINRIPHDARVGVIGDGGAASSVILALLEEVGSGCEIVVISQSGVTYTRGESYDENRHYSDADYWAWLDSQSRKRFIRHTSRGVFPVHAKGQLNDAENLSTVSGDVKGIVEIGNQVQIFYHDPEPDEDGFVPPKRDDEFFDFVVVAIGFDELWWTRKLSTNAENEITAHTKNGKLDFPSVSYKIGEHLEVDGLSPRLHLPMLAGDRQGPGFPSLGCLGLLSDRILSLYCGATPDK
ncbi:hypothetical protein ACIA98_36725 [Streptomyces sp. NPDC051366]|uniref:hypothetical protein n=1 Tax=Streptomyces sp. NPDC051366 TaxID=3365652 RepID=UPI0037B11C00